MKKADRRARRIAVLMAILTLSLMSHLFAQQGLVALQNDLNDLEIGDDWIYGDLEKGIALAKESGKPLFVLFR